MTKMAYIGRMTVSNKHHAAGTVVCATVDEPGRTKVVARTIAEWSRDGLTIERVPVEWARLHLFTTEPAP